MAVKIDCCVGLVLLVLSITECGGDKTSNCIYQYTQQPVTQLNCDPNGSRLQIHCGATGPLLPSFRIQWYRSNRSVSSTTRITSKNDCLIRNNMLDVMDEKRSATSILLTKNIDSTMSGVCFWCQIEFSRLILPVKSEVVCIDNEEHFAGVDDCGDSVVMLVNTSVLCVHVSPDLASALESLNNERDIITTPTISSNILSLTGKAQSGSSLVSTMFGSEAIQSSKTFINTQTLHIGTKVATSIAKTQVYATPSSKLKDLFVSSSTTESPMNNTTSSTVNTIIVRGMEETVPRSSFEGALYAAIIVCILFIGVIVGLVIMILCLVRKKCSCLVQVSDYLRQKLHRATNSRRNSQEANHVSDTNHVSEQVDGSVLEQGSVMKGTQVEVSFSEQSRTLASESSTPSGHLKRLTIETESRLATLADKPPPELPPKPKKSNTPASYDHLEPVTIRVDNSTMVIKSSTSMHSAVSTSEMHNEKLPKVPDHYYHTLEDDGSGMLRSATASHTSSQAFNVGGGENIDKVSAHLQELFDDPRYARLKLDPYGEGDYVRSGLTKQKDFSRSSPSIVTLIQPQETLMKRGATERRSLRLPRWISTTKTRPDIYEN